MITTKDAGFGETVRYYSRRADTYIVGTGEPVKGWFAVAARTKAGVRVRAVQCWLATNEQHVINTAINFSMR